MGLFYLHYMELLQYGVGGSSLLMGSAYGIKTELSYSNPSMKRMICFLGVQENQIIRSFP